MPSLPAASVRTCRGKHLRALLKAFKQGGTLPALPSASPSTAGGFTRSPSVLSFSSTALPGALSQRGSTNTTLRHDDESARVPTASTTAPSPRTSVVVTPRESAVGTAAAAAAAAAAGEKAGRSSLLDIGRKVHSQLSFLAQMARQARADAAEAAVAEEATAVTEPPAFGEAAAVQGAHKHVAVADACAPAIVAPAPAPAHVSASASSPFPLKAVAHHGAQPSLPDLKGLGPRALVAALPPNVKLPVNQRMLPLSLSMRRFIGMPEDTSGHASVWSNPMFGGPGAAMPSTAGDLQRAPHVGDGAAPPNMPHARARDSASGHTGSSLLHQAPSLATAHSDADTLHAMPSLAWQASQAPVAQPGSAHPEPHTVTLDPRTSSLIAAQDQSGGDLDADRVATGSLLTLDPALSEHPQLDTVISPVLQVGAESEEELEDAGTLVQLPSDAGGEQDRGSRIDLDATAMESSAAAAVHGAAPQLAPPRQENTDGASEATPMANKRAGEAVAEGRESDSGSSAPLVSKRRGPPPAASAAAAAAAAAGSGVAANPAKLTPHHRHKSSNYSRLLDVRVDEWRAASHFPRLVVLCVQRFCCSAWLHVWRLSFRTQWLKSMCHSSCTVWHCTQSGTARSAAAVVPA